MSTAASTEASPPNRSYNELELLIIHPPRSHKKSECNRKTPIILE